MRHETAEITSYESICCYEYGASLGKRWFHHWGACEQVTIFISVHLWLLLSMQNPTVSSLLPWKVGCDSFGKTHLFGCRGLKKRYCMEVKSIPCSLSVLPAWERLLAFLLLGWLSERNMESQSSSPEGLPIGNACGFTVGWEVLRNWCDYFLLPVQSHYEWGKQVVHNSSCSLLCPELLLKLMASCHGKCFPTVT